MAPSDPARGDSESRNGDAPARAAPTLRRILFPVLLAMGLLPLLAAELIMAARQIDAQEARLHAQLRQLATTSAASLDRFLAEHARAVAALADTPGLAGADEATRLQLLEALRARLPGFRTAIVTDAEGLIIAASPRANDEGVEDFWRSERVADRPYFIEPQRGGEAFRSPVFAGRGFGSELIVALSAPVFDAQGGFAGIAEGSLSLEAVGNRVQRTLGGDALEVAVTDEEGHVVFATEELSLPLLAADQLERRLGLAVDALQPGAVRVAEAPGLPDGAIGSLAVSDAGWRVLTLAPGALVRRELLAELRILALVISLTLVAVAIAATVVSRRLAAPLSTLARRITEFAPDKPWQPWRAWRPDPRASAETVAIDEAFDRLAVDLREGYADLLHTIEEKERLERELRGTVESREAEIRRRTEELRSAVNALHELSSADPMTGLANYRSYRQALGHAFERAQRRGHCVGLILVDIDHFKRLNDALGHPAGDACLRRVAEALREVAGPEAEVIARIGGEEFALVIEHARFAPVEALALRLVERVRALAVAHPDAPDGRVTVSAGAALSAGGGQQPIERLVSAADAALYRAKQGGRDRVDVEAEVLGL